MLLTIGLIIAIVSTFTEVKLVHGSKTVRRLYTQGAGPIDGVWFNTAGSFLLSYFIGKMFAAEGVTIMLGAALSTGLSQAFFMVEGFCEKRNITMNMGAIKATASARTASVRKGAAQWMTLIHDFIKLIKIILMVITIPFRMARAISNGIHKVQTVRAQRALN